VGEGPPLPHSPAPVAPRSLVYGRRPVLEALRGGRAVRQVWLAEGVKAAPVVAAIILAAHEAGAPVHDATRQQLDELVDAAHHQGVVAEVTAFAPVELSDLLAVARQRQEAPLLVVADHLEDPQNLGALMRSAEAAGAHGLVLPDRRSAGITPAVVRASAGAAEHLLVASVVNLSRAFLELQHAGLWIVGLDAGARMRYNQADLRVPLAVVVGGEGKGLTRLVSERCDLLVRLPMAGRTASLNAAVAGAIVLYEAVRQRTTPQ
jgi:23S rRNA (guanosine2251-2'-O)-methyltransferase